MGRKRILLVGQAFSKWGGFYTPPTEALSGPITEHEVEDQYSPSPNSPLAQVRMQRAQRMWKKLFDELRTPKKPNTEEEDKVDSAVAANVSETTEVGSVEESLGEDSTTSTVSASETSDLATSQPSDPLAPTSEPAPTTTTSTSTSPSEPPTEPFRPAFTQSLTRRQRLLVQARENARTPLPEALIPPTAEELKAKAEAEEKEKAREAAKASSLKTRLLNLIGGKWA